MKVYGNFKQTAVLSACGEAVFWDNLKTVNTQISSTKGKATKNSAGILRFFFVTNYSCLFIQQG